MLLTMLFVRVHRKSMVWGENLQHTYSRKISANAPVVLVGADCLPAHAICHKEADSMIIHLAIQISEGAQPGSRIMAPN